MRSQSYLPILFLLLASVPSLTHPSIYLLLTLVSSLTHPSILLLLTLVRVLCCSGWLPCTWVFVLFVWFNITVILKKVLWDPSLTHPFIFLWLTIVHVLCCSGWLPDIQLRCWTVQRPSPWLEGPLDPGQDHTACLSQHQQVFHGNWVKTRWRRVLTLGGVCWATVISSVCHSINRYFMKIGWKPDREGFRHWERLLGHRHIEHLSQRQQVLRESWVKARRRRVSTFGEVCWVTVISSVCHRINRYFMKTG